MTQQLAGDAEEQAARDMIVKIFGAIGLVIVSVAGMAVASGMAVGLYERRHEFAALQAVGGRRRHVFRMVFAELLPLAAVGWAGCLLAACWLLTREAPLRSLLPGLCVVGLQTLWYAVPAVLRIVWKLPLDGLAFAVIWSSAAHALQYLWVTSYYAANSQRRERIVTFLGKSVLAGCAVVVLPGLVFAPGVLGRISTRCTSSWAGCEASRRSAR